MELVTAWVLTKGPCGPQCSKNDVGSSTKVTREKSLMTNPIYFGNFSVDFPDDTSAVDQRTIEKSLNDEVHSNYTEVVLAVSEHANWEQDLLKFSFELEEHRSQEDFK